MNKLEELLKETDFTAKEWEAYKKVEKNCQLSDLNELLDEMLHRREITKQQYETICNNAGIVVEKYNKWLDYDWRETMKDAIDYVLQEKWK